MNRSVPLDYNVYEQNHSLDHPGENEPLEPHSKPDYATVCSYHDRFQQERRDLWKFLPSRIVEHFPRNGNEGLLGYTYRIDGKIHKQEGMNAETDLLTTIHETIHTECEYETRVLAEWILHSMYPPEEKYNTKPPEYTS